MTSTEASGVGRLYPWVTIETLPDSVLLETFEIYLGKDDPDKIDEYHNYDEWQTLVHVCHRWRCIVFASPHRLNLKLYCTPQRSVDSKTLDIWPTLPIVVFSRDLQSNDDVTKVSATLRHHNRVCKIHYRNGLLQDSLLREFAAIDEPFPALTSLELISFGQDVPILPDSFLGGSAPLLQSLELAGIRYPSIGTLLSSTTNLVKLSLWNIPRSGYVTPETIVPCLSMLTRLELLELKFRYPRSPAHRTSPHPSPLTRVVFPNLTYLSFCGDIEYLEDILSLIETPMLSDSNFYFFNQLVFETPLLGHFTRRTELFTTIHTARVQFFDWGFWLVGQKDVTADTKRIVLSLHVRCKALDWQLSAAAQVSKLFLSSQLALETLEIRAVVPHENHQSEIDVIQWREFLHPFTSVKTMTLGSEDPVRLITPALQEFAKERSTLPALQTLRVFSSQSSGSFKEAIGEFIATRQSYGQYITIYQCPLLGHQK